MDFERDSPVGSSMFTLNPFGLIISKNVAGKQYMSLKEMAFSSVSSSSSSPCAACKFLRRKCTVECVFAPYFSPEQPHKFASVHKIFGASNISKLLNELPSHQREDAVTSLAYEAEARVKDPVYGCVGAISVLQGQVQQLQRELAEARADLARYTALEMRMQGNHGVPVHHSSHRFLESRRERAVELARVQGSGGPCSEALGVAAGIYYNITPSSPTSLPTHPPPACTAPHTGWCEFMRRETYYDEYEGFY